MSTELRVIIDQLVASVPGGIGRYTEELTRELIATAPPGCTVSGVVSAVIAEEVEHVQKLLPDLAELIRLPLPRRELSLAWRFGAASIPGRSTNGAIRSLTRGMTHSPSVLAPLVRHDRVNSPGTQTVVTVHDVVPWTHPETLTRNGVAFHRVMVARAHRHADAVVVPTHAVAEELSGIYSFGDRVKVIGGAPSSKLKLPVDPTERAARLGLPERYILAVGTLEPRKRLSALIESLAHPDSVGLPLVIAGPLGWGGVDVDAVAAAAGLEPERVQALGYLSDADLAVAIQRATVFVMPSIAEGFGLPVVEAFSLGTPVVHSDAPAIMEVSAGAGVSVERMPDAGYPARLAQTIASVVNDSDRLEDLRIRGLDRAKAFSWKNSATQVWQLHADL